MWILGFTPSSICASYSVLILHSVLSCHVVLGGCLPLVFMVFWTQVLGIPSHSAVIMHWVWSGLSSPALFGITRSLEVISTGGKQSNNWENKRDQYLILCSQPTFPKPHLYWFLWATLPFLGNQSLCSAGEQVSMTYSCFWRGKDGCLPELPGGGREALSGLLWTNSLPWPGWHGYWSGLILVLDWRLTKSRVGREMWVSSHMVEKRLVSSVEENEL